MTNSDAHIYNADTHEVRGSPTRYLLRHLYTQKTFSFGGAEIKSYKPEVTLKLEIYSFVPLFLLVKIAPFKIAVKKCINLFTIF